MAFQYVHGTDEISSINFDDDYIEISHGEFPDEGSQVSYKMKVQDLYDHLSAEIQKIVKVNKVVDIDTNDIGKIFYASMYPNSESEICRQLLSSDFIPLTFVNGKKISLFQLKKSDPSVHYNESMTELEVHRSDLSAFFEFAEKNSNRVVQKMSNRVRINPEYLDGRYFCNIGSQDLQFETLSSSAPAISGWFPPGNKPMSVEELSDFIDGCWQMDEKQAEVYISKQSATMKNGIKYDFDASLCSGIYGKDGKTDSITLNSVNYVPYMVVKSDTVSVRF